MKQQMTMRLWNNDKKYGGSRERENGVFNLVQGVIRKCDSLVFFCCFCK